jgi:hypothetical protein
MQKAQLMKKSTRKQLLAQGFDQQDVDNNSRIVALSKWTPLACAFFGAIGVIFQSPVYLVILGLLTFVGAITSGSLYDYLYSFLFKYLFDLGEMPKHGIPRRIGCAIGACMFIASGLGFYLDNLPLAYIPSLFMITFAFIAGIFNWCFVSTFYGMVVGKKQECCH